MSSEHGLPNIDPAALARAEAALSNLSDRYLAWVSADLVRLEACLADITCSQEPCPEDLKRLFGIAHDMKGQGTTFDYPLISDLGNRLCRLLESSSPRPSAEVMERITALTAAMGQVIRGHLSGDGGEDGRRLLAGLL